MELRGPVTVDNFEGLAAVPRNRPTPFRFYLISDDNFSSSQRTLLLAVRLEASPGRGGGR